MCILLAINRAITLHKTKIKIDCIYLVAVSLAVDQEIPVKKANEAMNYDETGRRAVQCGI